MKFGTKQEATHFLWYNRNNSKIIKIIEKDSKEFNCRIFWKQKTRNKYKNTWNTL